MLFPVQARALRAEVKNGSLKVFSSVRPSLKNLDGVFFFFFFFF